MFGPLIERIAAELDRRRLPYMVAGGQAVLLYGEPRLTRDIDITLGVDLDRLADVQEAALAAGFTPLVDSEPFVRETMVLPCVDAGSGIRIDFIFSFSPYEAEALLRARCVTVGSTPVRFVSPEDLIILKIVAGRDRDLEDVRILMARNRGLDRPWIERWLGVFGRALDVDYLSVFHGLSGGGR